jgi:hypothetical protein
MQFMLTRRAERSAKPDPEAYARMGRLIHEMTGAGVLVAADAVVPNSAMRLSYAEGKQTLTEGTFDDSPGFDAFILIDVRSQDEAIEWSGRLAAAHAAANVEIRQLAEMSKATPEGGRATILSTRTG